MGHAARGVAVRRLIAVALLGAVLAGSGQAMLKPFAIALVVMGVVASLGGVAAFLGLRGRWQRSSGIPDAS